MGRKDASIQTVRSLLEEIDQRLGKGMIFGYSKSVLKFKGRNHYAFYESVQKH